MEEIEKYRRRDPIFEYFEKCESLPVNETNLYLRNIKTYRQRTEMDSVSRDFLHSVLKDER